MEQQSQSSDKAQHLSAVPPILLQNEPDSDSDVEFHSGWEGPDNSDYATGSPGSRSKWQAEYEASVMYTAPTTPTSPSYRNSFFENLAIDSHTRYDNNMTGSENGNNEQDERMETPPESPSPRPVGAWPESDSEPDLQSAHQTVKAASHIDSQATPRPTLATLGLGRPPIQQLRLSSAPGPSFSSDSAESRAYGERASPSTIRGMNLSGRKVSRTMLYAFNDLQKAEREDITARASGDTASGLDRPYAPHPAADGNRPGVDDEWVDFVRTQLARLFPYGPSDQEEAGTQGNPGETRTMGTTESPTLRTPAQLASLYPEVNLGTASPGVGHKDPPHGEGSDQSPRTPSFREELVSLRGEITLLRDVVGELRGEIRESHHLPPTPAVATSPQTLGEDSKNPSDNATAAHAVPVTTWTERTELPASQRQSVEVSEDEESGPLVGVPDLPYAFVPARRQPFRLVSQGDSYKHAYAETYGHPYAYTSGYPTSLTRGIGHSTYENSIAQYPLVWPDGSLTIFPAINQEPLLLARGTLDLILDVVRAADRVRTASTRSDKDVFSDTNLNQLLADTNRLYGAASAAAASSAANPQPESRPVDTASGVSRHVPAVSTSTGIGGPDFGEPPLSATSFAVSNGDLNLGEEIIRATFAPSSAGGPPSTSKHGRWFSVDTGDSRYEGDGAETEGTGDMSLDELDESGREGDDEDERSHLLSRRLARLEGRSVSEPFKLSSKLSVATLRSASSVATLPTNSTATPIPLTSIPSNDEMAISPPSQQEFDVDLVDNRLSNLNDDQPKTPTTEPEGSEQIEPADGATACQPQPLEPLHTGPSQSRSRSGSRPKHVPAPLGSLPLHAMTPLIPAAALLPEVLPSESITTQPVEDEDEPQSCQTTIPPPPPPTAVTALFLAPTVPPNSAVTATFSAPTVPPNTPITAVGMRSVTPNPDTEVLSVLPEVPEEHENEHEAEPTTLGDGISTPIPPKAGHNHVLESESDYDTLVGAIEGLADESPAPLPL